MKISEEQLGNELVLATEKVLREKFPSGLPPEVREAARLRCGDIARAAFAKQPEKKPDGGAKRYDDFVGSKFEWP